MIVSDVDAFARSPIAVSRKLASGGASPVEEVGDGLLGGRVLDEDPDDAAREDGERDDGEQRVERDAGGEQPATDVAEPIQHGPDAEHPPVPEERLARSSTAAAPRPAFCSDAAARPSALELLEQRRAGGRRRGRGAGAATRALTSPRRTNRRPPSLMLWSLPDRAQLPIVSGRKRMFAASRISLASARVIQSVAAGAIRQSAAAAVEPPDDDPVGVAGRRSRRVAGRRSLGVAATTCAARVDSSMPRSSVRRRRTSSGFVVASSFFAVD